MSRRDSDHPSTHPSDKSYMSRATDFAQTNGWPELAARIATGLQRRVRDRMTARFLEAPGFRAGRAPRLLGLRRMQIGEDFHAGDALWLEAVTQYGGRHFEPKLTIGAHARLSDNVHIACLDSVTVGAHLLSGSRVLISDHTHGRYDGHGVDEDGDPAVPPALRPLHSPGPIVIGKNVWLGEGVAVLAGAHIGDGCVIGANSVVVGFIPAETVAVGAPARPIRRWNAGARAWQPLRRPEISGLVD